jgi:hypothetical protein
VRAGFMVRGGGISRCASGKKEKNLRCTTGKGEAGTRRAATQGGKPVRVRRKGFQRTETESFFFVCFSFAFFFNFPSFLLPITQAGRTPHRGRPTPHGAMSHGVCSLFKLIFLFLFLSFLFLYLTKMPITGGR